MKEYLAEIIYQTKDTLHSIIKFLAKYIISKLQSLVMSLQKLKYNVLHCECRCHCYIYDLQLKDLSSQHDKLKHDYELMMSEHEQKLEVNGRLEAKVRALQINSQTECDSLGQQVSGPFSHE